MINRRLLLTGSIAAAGSLALQQPGSALESQKRRRPRRKTNLTQFVGVIAYDAFFEPVQIVAFSFQARTEPRNAKYLQDSPRPILLGVVFHPDAVWVDVDLLPGVKRQINLRGYRIALGKRRVLVPSLPQGTKLTKVRAFTFEDRLDWPGPRRANGIGRPNRWIAMNRRGWGPGGAQLSAQSLSLPDAPPDRSKLIPISSLESVEE